MATKFKIGDEVVGLKSASGEYVITKWAWVGEIVKIRNPTKANSGEDILVVSKEKKEVPYWVSSKHFKKFDMAKKVDDTIVVKEGDYFTATYNRKKIRGIVGIYNDSVTLFNNQAGQHLKCEEDNETGLTYGIKLREFEDGTAAELKKARVNNYTVLKDRRQKAIIDKDKLPEIEVSNSDYKVSIEDGLFVFGCGAVELTKEQIEGYLRHRVVTEKLEELEGNSIEDLSVEEIERYLEIKKETDEDDEGLYDEVVRAASSEGHYESDLNHIPEENIKALFKYATHIAAGVK